MVNFQALNLPVSCKDVLAASMSQHSTCPPRPPGPQTPENKKLKQSKCLFNTQYGVCATISGFKPKSWVPTAKVAFKSGSRK